MLSQPKITSIADFKMLVTTVAVVTKENVNEKSFSLASDILESSLAQIENDLESRDLGIEELEQAMKASFDTISNLIGHTEKGKFHGRTQIDSKVCVEASFIISDEPALHFWQ